MFNPSYLLDLCHTLVMFMFIVHVHQLCFYDVTYETHMVEIGRCLILFYFIAIFYLYICFIIFDKYFFGEYSDMCVLRQR